MERSACQPNASEDRFKLNMPPLQLHLGVKTDAIEYRYSHDWLFCLLAEENVRRVQLGTFFEIYDLPDEYFQELSVRAARFGVRIQSVFTAHRELGGFFQRERGFEQVARRKFERLIEIGGFVGAASVGSNPGAVLRDRMDLKAGKEKGTFWLCRKPGRRKES